MKRMGNRILSVVMTLCLVLSLLPTFAAADAATSVTLGGITLTYSNAAIYAVAGTEAGSETTDGATDLVHNVVFNNGTLTLAGVDFTSGITFNGDAVIVLQGANRVAGTISATGSLTISGSGTLEVTPTSGNGISAASLSVNSGYVNVTDSADTAVNVTGAMTVSGGYFVAENNTAAGSGISAASLTVSSGYVKATGVTAGVTGAATVSAGYLEASGAAGIVGAVANSDGVIKTAGTAGNGITGTANCTGGVTIASGTSAAISSNITGDSSENLYSNVGGTLTADAVRALSTTEATSDLTGVVIAKKVSTTQLADTSLDGAYIYVTSGHGWKPASDATVAGSSYIYGNVNSTSSDVDGCYPQAGLTVDATLVVAGTGGGIYSEGTSIKVSDTGNLITPNKTGMYITNKTSCTLTNSGNIVTDTKYTGINISGGTINQNGGSIVSVRTDTNSSLYGIDTKEFNVNGGCVTAYAPNAVGISCFNLTQTGGAVTAVSTSDNGGINYNNLTNQSTTGAITVPDGKAVLGSTGLYGSLKKTYRKTYTGASIIRTSLSTTSIDYARVVFLSGDAPDPTVTVAAADTTALTAGDTSTTKTYNVTGENIGRLSAITYYGTIVSSIKWYSDAEGKNELSTAPSGIYICSGATAATLSAKLNSTAVTPGDYYFRLSINDTEYTPNDVLTSNVVTLNVGKKTLSPTPTLSTTVSTAGTTGSTVTLPDVKAGGTYGTPVVGGTTAALISGTPSISGSTLTFNTTAQTAGTSATITIPVTGCTEYQNYDIVVTVTSSEFGATLSGTVTGFTGVALSNKTVTVTLTGDTFASSLTTSGWVKNLPTGLATSVARTSDTVATITFTGSPTVASTAQIAVTIPANCITSHTTAYEVPTNASAVYAITASTYTMTLTAGTPDTFTDLTYGYTTGSSVTYTITNTGNQKLTNLRASMSGGNSSSFNYTLSGYTIPTGKTATVTVTSKTGLDAGTHTDTLTVSAYNVTTTNAPTASLSQTVTKADYSGTVTKTVPIYCGSVNTGTVTMADLFGTTIPTDAAFSAVTPPSGTPSVMDTVAVNGTDTTKLDYTSLSTAAAGSSDAYTVTITSKNYNDITATITFTAQNPLVTFDACGGAWSDSATTKTATISGGAVTEPEDPTYSGYTFVGWYRDKYYTTAFTNSSLTTNTTVYAMWKRTSDNVILRNTTLYFNGDGKLYETLEPYVKGGSPVLKEVSTTTDGDKTVVPGWSADGTTLTLSDLNFLTQNATGLYIYTDDAIITLAAGTTNTLQSVCADEWSCGVYGAVQSLTIDDSGTLNAAGGDVSGINYCESVGIKAYGSIIINSGTVNATGGKSARNSAGIYSYDYDVTINGGTVKAVGGTSTSVESGTGSAGIVGYSAVSVTGGTVTATAGEAGTEAYSAGIFVWNEKTGTASFTGGTTTASGNDKVTNKFAVMAKNITVTTVAITSPSGGTIGASGNYQTILSSGTAAASATIGKKSSGGSSTSTTTTSTVVVDGKTTDAGKVTTTTNTDGTKNNTVAVDTTKLNAQVATADKGSSVQVTVPTSTGTASAQLVVKDVENLSQKDMSLEIKTGDTTYTVAPNAIDTAKVASELGASDTSKVPLTVTVTPVKQSDVTVSKGTQVADPVKFEVTATYNGKTVAVSTFSSYVERAITIPANVDPNKITTGIRVEDGEQVPTFVTKNADGTSTAKVNSLTNSTYAIIYNEASFSDTVGKWYNDIVTEMASRTIVNGKTATTFDGDGYITRAEYAAILVRALGIPEGGTSSFSDVASGDWYYGAVGAAVQYGIIKGYDDGSFKPLANISRQEAMAMLQRAAKVAEYAGTTGTLASFTDADQVAAWAEAAAQFNVGSGLIVGSDGQIRPTDNITRAEAATAVLRLLQKSGLVDIRSKT